jgi:hypothetical protein
VAFSYLPRDPTRITCLSFFARASTGSPNSLPSSNCLTKRLVDDLDYSFFVGELPRWFRPEVLNNLDEQGIPIQILKRFHADGDTMQSLSERLVLAAAEAADAQEDEDLWQRQA